MIAKFLLKATKKNDQTSLSLNDLVSEHFEARVTNIIAKIYFFLKECLLSKHFSVIFYMLAKYKYSTNVVATVKPVLSDHPFM